MEVMDFSDRFVNGLWDEIDGSFADDPDPATRVAALSWKLRYGSASMEIASGADPRTTLLDMAIFITAGEWALTHYWIPEIFGEKGAGLLSHYRAMNRSIWELVAETLTDEQTALLRSLVDRWIATSPKRFEVSTVRFRNLEGVNPEDFRKERTARGLLASVRHWLGEVNTSLLFGERVLFYIQRTPRILNQQTDLTLAQIGNDFPIATFNPDLSTFTDYLETLPEKIQAGIEANPWVTQDFLPGITGTIEGTQNLVTSSTKLVASANELSTTINTTLDRLSALVPSQHATDVSSIDYQLALAQTTTALTSLDSSITGLNQLLAPDDIGESKVSTLLEQLDTQADRLIDRTFARALWLMGVFFGGVAILMILARFLFGNNRKKKHPDEIYLPQSGISEKRDLGKDEQELH